MLSQLCSPVFLFPFDEAIGLARDSIFFDYAMELGFVASLLVAVLTGSFELDEFCLLSLIRHGFSSCRKEGSLGIHADARQREATRFRVRNLDFNGKISMTVVRDFEKHNHRITRFDARETKRIGLNAIPRFKIG